MAAAPRKGRVAEANARPAIPAEPLRFAFWTVRPDIVLDNLRMHREETGEIIQAVPIEGDYAAAIEVAFERNCGPHVFYAQRAEAACWADRGLIAPLDEHDFRPLLDRMEPKYVAGARDGLGRLLGLTYYNAGPFALLWNEAMFEGTEPNFDGWDALIETCRRLRRDGVSRYPFVPRWHSTQTGLMWSLLCHLASEGVLDLDDPDAADALQRLLACWASLVDEELVPPESLLDTRDLAAVKRWAGGAHALTFNMDYLVADTAALAPHTPPFSVPAVRLPGASGTPLLPGHALICLAAGLEPSLAERGRSLIRYLGGTAPDGDLRVHRRWLAECLFPVPYPELNDDGEVRAAVARFFPEGRAEACLDRLFDARRRAVPAPPTHRPWMAAWSKQADELVRHEFLRHRRVGAAGAADRLLAYWFDLHRMWRGAQD